MKEYEIMAQNLTNYVHRSSGFYFRVWVRRLHDVCNLEKTWNGNMQVNMISLNSLVRLEQFLDKYKVKLNRKDKRKGHKSTIGMKGIFILHK